MATNSLTFFEVTGHFFAVADPSISGTQNTPVVQPINALVSFVPRLPKGQQVYVPEYLITNAYNSEQTINLLNNPTGGTFTIAYGGYTTTALPYDVTPAALQAALQALPSIGAGNVLVVNDPAPQAYDVQFTSGLAGQALQPLVGDPSLLSNAQGPGYCEITVTVTEQGSPLITANTAISVPMLTARIYNGVLSTIDYADTPGFQLVANTAILGLTGALIYDVSFSNVTFNGNNQVLAPFAFTAPTDATPVDLSDPALTRLAWQYPSQTMWQPGASLMSPAPLRSVGGTSWRSRSIRSA